MILIAFAWCQYTSHKTVDSNFILWKLKRAANTIHRSYTYHQTQKQETFQLLPIQVVRINIFFRSYSQSIAFTVFLVSYRILIKTPSYQSPSINHDARTLPQQRKHTLYKGLDGLSSTSSSCFLVEYLETS